MNAMRMHIALSSFIVCGAMMVVAPAAMAAAGPTLLGSFKDWSAYTTDTGNGKVCYALSQPKSMAPKGAKRDPVFFLISDWPSRKSKAEPEVVPGYPYKVGSTVTAQVGKDKFTFFTQNDGNSGSAWVKENADEVRLVEAMRRGSRLTVSGTSTRGTDTRDTYSLSGISAALDKIHAECKM